MPKRGRTYCAIEINDSEKLGWAYEIFTRI